MAKTVADNRFQWREVVPAIIVLVILFIGIAVAFLAPRGTDDQYIVVVPPWRSLTSVIGSIQKTEATIVSIDASESVITIHSEDKNLPSKLYSAGEWLVFEPLLPGGCFAIQEWAAAI